ncbi:MAG: ATP-dependent DNA ligase [Nitrososphaeria archaeon]
MDGITGNSFKEFARVCEAVRGTSSKNVKVGMIAEYLRKLDDERLRIACQLLSGEVFPPWKNVSLQVGYSTLVSIISDISGRDEKALRPMILKHGDLGEAAEEILSTKVISPLVGQEYDLKRFHQELTRIAETSGKGAFMDKKRILTGLYLNMSPTEAKYVTKILTGEMRIGLVGGLVIESIANAFSQKLEEVNEAYLLTSDIGQTALLARYGRLKEAKLEPLHQTSFMLAEAMQTPEEIEKHFRKPLFCEYKLDGIRAQCHKKSEDVKIFTRRGNDSSSSFPEIVEGLKEINHDYIVDGEIIAFKDGRPLPFSLLQQRVQRKVITGELVAKIPLTIFIYDILFLDGKSVFNKPLSERKNELKKLNFSDKIRMLDYTTVTKKEEIEILFEESKRKGYEGLMLKDPSSPYTVGRRGKNWVKLKKELDTLDVVVVASERGHGRRANIFSDFVFAVWDRGELKTIGKAYSGLTDKELSEMDMRLREITVRDEGWRIIVRPEIVIEVAFNNVQKSDRHESGFALRFPRIKRIRDDKSIEQADTIEKVKAIYGKQFVRR